MARNSGTARKNLSFDIMEKYAHNFEAALLKNGLVEEATDFMKSFKTFGADVAPLEINPEWPDQVFRDLEAAATGYRGKKGEIQAYIAVREYPETANIKTVEALHTAVCSFLKKGKIDGWIYKRNEALGVDEPWLVTDVQYHKEYYYGRGQDRERVPPSVSIHFAANGNRGNGVNYQSLSFSEGNLGQNVAHLLHAVDIQHETPTLKAEYEKHLALFVRFKPQEGKQFRATGKAIPVQKDSDDWYSTRRNSVVAWDMAAAKVVNDEAMVQRYVTPKIRAEFWGTGEQAEQHFGPLSVHCSLYCYDLEKHTNAWVHVTLMEEYVFDPTLRDKIVLPPEHRDLIEILTSDISVFQEVGDVISGKSGGTFILCVGKPGLGKTLTAEIYSEVCEKPLYKIHSGQLGTSHEAIQSKLEEHLKRAARWGAIMLIDEADVYIRKRGDDVDHNAIVASFLRTLEYFNGLLFMTTNREDDIDDAIQSRAMAVFKYQVPKPREAAQIWRIMADEFRLKLTDETIAELSNPESGIAVVGRDIKQLLKLTARYCDKKQIPLSFDAFRICAMFRGFN